MNNTERSSDTVHPVVIKTSMDSHGEQETNNSWEKCFQNLTMRISQIQINMCTVMRRKSPGLRMKGFG